MIWIIALSVLVAIGRFMIPGHGLSWPGTYEAMAHIWVGALLVLCFQGKDRKAAIVCLVAITALETVMFMAR